MFKSGTHSRFFKSNSLWNVLCRLLQKIGQKNRTPNNSIRPIPNNYLNSYPLADIYLPITSSEWPLPEIGNSKNFPEMRYGPEMLAFVNVPNISFFDLASLSKPLRHESILEKIFFMTTIHTNSNIVLSMWKRWTPVILARLNWILKLIGPFAPVSTSTFVVSYGFVGTRPIWGTPLP